jgi:peptidoglycan/xylan/chitin deacetylase (PgdA/CDA1 family)
MLSASSAVGLFRVLRNSRWRSAQLLILCYHGISIDDEHEWAPGLYMTADMFAARLALLRRRQCTVLPLEEGVRRLYDGTLPPRSVVITFDDGNADFHARAWPVLKSFGHPATVYLTTYYSEVNVPVFPVAVSYVLWKGRGVERPLATPGRAIAIDTTSESARRRTHRDLLRHAQDEGMSAADKDRLVERLAASLGVDYGAIKRKRLLHLMNEDEVREVAAGGIDVQLHSHRHRSPPTRELYRAEIAENRERIVPLTGTRPRHFCYPSGVWQPAFARWLEEEGVSSATTTEPGIASPRSDRYRLPRLLDHSELTPIEFDAWLTGLGALLPHRPLGTNSVDEKGRLAIGAASPPVAGWHPGLGSEIQGVGHAAESGE